MIKFLNDQVRGEFHLLPVDRQKAFHDEAQYFAGIGHILLILHVERFGDGTSEVTVRIGKEPG